MQGFWQGNFEPQPVSRRGSAGENTSQLARMAELEHQIARLMLLNQALWELLRPRLKMTDADLEALVAQIDVRDGVEDGKITHNAVKCPQCGRVSNSKHWKCLYCGLEFEKPVFG